MRQSPRGVPPRAKPAARAASLPATARSSAAARRARPPVLWSPARMPPALARAATTSLRRDDECSLRSPLPLPIPPPQNPPLPHRREAEEEGGEADGRRRPPRALAAPAPADIVIACRSRRRDGLCLAFSATLGPIAQGSGCEVMDRGEGGGGAEVVACPGVLPSLEEGCLSAGCWVVWVCLGPVQNTK